jgi:hypothetical protein
MRNQSFINGTAQLNGGNINIESDLLVGDTTSFISANAFEGLGGEIKINTKGLIFDPQNITATSDRGDAYEGSVNLKFTTSNSSHGLNLHKVSRYEAYQYLVATVNNG